MRIPNRNLSRLLVLAALALGATPVFAMPPTSAAAADCQFVLGFKTLYDLIPEIVGTCATDEIHNPENGDGLQLTTRGLMVWRKIDNNTAFTDGTISWVNGPLGVQSRANNERFPWEVAAAAAAPPPSPAATSAPPPPSGTTPPQAPAPALQTTGGPVKTPADQVLLTLNDVGKSIDIVYSKNGSDSRGSWAEIRFVRGDEFWDQGLGPLKIVNRVYIANDAASGQAIFKDEVGKQNSFPESEDNFAGVFVNQGKDAIAKVGDEQDSRGACGNHAGTRGVDCSSPAFDALHERTVVRSQNAVIVLYYWGRNRYATPTQTNDWLGANMARL